MFKVNNKDTGKTPLARSGVFVVNFEHISTPWSSVSIVNFEHVNADWISKVELYEKSKHFSNGYLLAVAFVSKLRF